MIETKCLHFYLKVGKNCLITEDLYLRKSDFVMNVMIKTVCNNCNNQINENKDFEANLKVLKRHPPNEFGHMLHYYII